MWMQKQSKYENMAYVALWSLLFAAPLLSLYVRTTGDDTMTFDWQEVFMVWRRLAVFLLLFLVHNFVLAPLLIHRQKRWLYALLTVCMIGLFTFYQCSHRPPMERPFNHEPPPMEHRDDFPGHRKDIPRHHRNVPPAIIGEHDIIAIVILILMLGVNLGIKSYFKSRDDQKELLRLEKENLKQQLEYLKYQINPHFFMNTLNNIHALVDIDPEKAKTTILELSKLMRFVLYEGNKARVPLDREISFVQNYITLMKIRYTDKVRITFLTPDTLPSKEVPPLIFITFVENAFKHGVTYQQESFIQVEFRMEQPDHLTFICRNSRIEREKNNGKEGGVGLTNVRQRLELIYGNRFILDIKDESNQYLVNLTIPL